MTPYIPPEVSVDACGRQVVVPGFRQYLPCAKGCGFLIGCGDAIGEIWHESCEGAPNDSEVPA